MARENVEGKGRRLLVEGRLIVQHVAGDRIVAKVRGDSGEVYLCGHDEATARWFCECEAKGKCSHLVALQLVTIRNRRLADGSH